MLYIAHNDNKLLRIILAGCKLAYKINSLAIDVMIKMLAKNKLIVILTHNTIITYIYTCIMSGI